MNAREQFLDSVTAGDIPHYSILEIAGGFASILSLLGSVLCILASLLSFGAALMFAVSPDRRMLPAIFGPPLLGLGFYGLAMLGGLTSLGFWSGVAVLALSYPALRRRAFRRAKRILGSSPRESVVKL